MASQNVYYVSDVPWYVFTKHLFVSLLDDLLGTFLQLPKNVLHVKDIRSYIHCKIESIDDEEIHKDLGTICNNYLNFKFEYAHLSELNLVKYMFYTEFDNCNWTQIILSRVHNDMLWLGDTQTIIENDLIHKVIGLSNEGCNPINEKNVRKKLEINLHTRFEGRNMKGDSI